MANIKSQIKRIRTAERQRMRNKGIKTYLKTTVRNYQASIEAGDTAAAAENLKIVVKTLDKAVSQGVVHKNNAANKKSSLVKTYNALAAAPKA